MSDQFFEKPILNSPYEYPVLHWELDDTGQPTQRIDERRREAKFVTPIPKPRRRRSRGEQEELVFGDGQGLSSHDQQYDVTGNVSEIRRLVDAWRQIPNPSDWGVTPETQRLLQLWRSHEFSSFRPFFCQVEAAETVIWLTEVAPGLRETTTATAYQLNPANLSVKFRISGPLSINSSCVRDADEETTVRT